MRGISRARAASGHAAAAPPSRVMKSRRLHEPALAGAPHYHTVCENAVVHHSKVAPAKTG